MGCKTSKGRHLSLENLLNQWLLSDITKVVLDYHTPKLGEVYHFYTNESLKLFKENPRSYNGQPGDLIVDHQKLYLTTFYLDNFLRPTSYEFFDRRSRSSLEGYLITDVDHRLVISPESQFYKEAKALFGREPVCLTSRPRFMLDSTWNYYIPTLTFYDPTDVDVAHQTSVTELAKQHIDYNSASVYPTVNRPAYRIDGNYLDNFPLLNDFFRGDSIFSEHKRPQMKSFALLVRPIVTDGRGWIWITAEPKLWPFFLPNQDNEV